MRSKRSVVPLTLLLMAGLLAPLAIQADPPHRPGARPGVRRAYVYPYWWHRPYWYDPYYGYSPYRYRRYPAVYYEEDLGTVFYYDDRQGLRQLGFLIYNIHGYFDGPSASNILASIVVSGDEKFIAVGGADRIGTIHIARL